MGNVQLLKDVRDNIVMFPQTHNQKTWLCETSMCIAGHAAVISGKAHVKIHPTYGIMLVDEHGEFAAAAEVGEKELGLSAAEREYLFFCMDNDISIKRIDQVISLWEEGKTVDDLLEEEKIEDPVYHDCCEDCG